jgi:SAM-dependent methyltransferase
MAWMYKSNEAMFADFDHDSEDAAQRIVEHYETDIGFTRLYIHHLRDSQRDNKLAYLGFESEMGAFQAVLRMVSELQSDLGLDLNGARVLDIGCASGHAMRAALKLGASTVVGIEYSEPRAFNGNNILSAFGHPPSIRAGSVLDETVTGDLPANFDYVFLFDVLEHVPSIEETFKVARSKLKKGGKIIIKSGNPYFPLFMLKEPHYALPGMILLDRESAAEYHAAHFDGAYDDVNEWLCKVEVEALLNRLGFRTISRRDATDAELGKFDEAIAELESIAYPSDEIRRKVRSATKLLKVMRATTQDPEQMFCVMNFVAVAEAI